MRRGLATTRTEAQRLIGAGLVTVAGAPAAKPAAQVSPAEAVAVAAEPERFASRGGHKLAGALDAFGVPVAGRRCLDAGASTGGFTDVLLQRDAAAVTAVDVGYGQLSWRLRSDERVVVRDRTNARHLTPQDVPGPAPELVVADLSFISLTLVLPALVAVAAPDADHVLLVKPQFEAGAEAVGRGGVVRDPAVWEAALRRVGAAAVQHGLGLAGATVSSLPGPAGNIEFFWHLRRGAAAHVDDAVAGAIERALRLRARAGPSSGSR